MRKKIVLVALSVMIAMSTTACVKGEPKEHATDTQRQILLNTGSCFAYTFRDGATGVWYMSTSDGVTPRLNADGSLYVTDN